MNILRDGPGTLRDLANALDKAASSTKDYRRVALGGDTGDLREIAAFIEGFNTPIRLEGSYCGHCNQPIVDATRGET